MIDQGEFQVIVDRGNNDWSFFVPDVEIVLVDPHRADEPAFFPGEVNLLRADVVVLTKLDTATPAQISTVRRFVGQVNPRATLVDTALPPTVDHPDRIHGKQVLVIEDGPTVTHGGRDSARVIWLPSEARRLAGCGKTLVLSPYLE